MKKKLLWIISGTLLTLMFALAWAPFVIKSYVESHYNVKVGNVRLGVSRLTFDGVEVNRGWLLAELKLVTVDWSRRVNIHGGAVTLNFDEKPEGANAGTDSDDTIEGQDLHLHVTKGDVQANFVDASFDRKKVSFGSANILHEGRTFQLKDGSITRDRKLLKAGSVEVSFSLPFDLPKITKEQTFKASGITIKPDDRLFEFDSATVEPTFSIKKHSKVQVLASAYRLELNDLEVNHPWVSPEAVTFASVVVKGPRTFETVDVELGKAKVTIEPETYHVRGSETCNDWIEAMPTPLPEALKQAKGKFKGTLTFEVVRDPAPQIKVSNDCRYACSQEPIKSLKSGKFSYMAYDKNDKLFRREAGPMAADWVPIEVLPPFVPKAFVTMEDPGFDHHRGIIVQALQNSLVDNLKLGKFFRGGSTISMQLAKNLWLKRHKTVGRKAQEALLTLALESCLTKAEILQLYLNVVEFGPNLYGIGPAAKRYFDKEAAKLEADEAFYLASIMPAPRKAVPPGSGGLARTRALMATLASRGFISDQLIPLEDMDSEGWQTE